MAFRTFLIWSDRYHVEPSQDLLGFSETGDFEDLRASLFFLRHPHLDPSKWQAWHGLRGLRDGLSSVLHRSNDAQSSTCRPVYHTFFTEGLGSENVSGG